MPYLLPPIVQPQRRRGAMPALLALALALSGCATADLPRGQDAYAIIPPPKGEIGSDYVLGPSDVISLTVLGEPELSLKDVQITSGGNISMPLVGQVQAAGLTAGALAKDLAARLASNMLIDPDVSVNVTNAASQKVTVEGSVTKPGIYQLAGKTTLLGALAMAEGTTKVSALSEVVIFRTMDGKPMGAVFDVGMIRRGELPDPEIHGSDTVVVGFSALKGAWRDVLSVAPVIAAFRAYR
ncbi:polysaccharide biosynthesis/export family protein [Sphingobium aquiterrae]|uniref:polysaccharide biosynthesis/export family protein n=1 Tax=Sphingobium aquiterrae TaxID=2038656 RepID=UPI003015B188